MSKNTSNSRGGMPVTNQQAAVIDHIVSNRVTVVGAGAGSGKTYTTVAAVLHLVEHRGVSLDQFILITFTNKAADELRTRISSALQQRCQQASSVAERRRWEEQVERLAAAFVGTIHSFCFRMLRIYGYGLGVARQAEATFARMLREEALRDAMEAYIEDNPNPPLFGTLATYEEYRFRDVLDGILNEIRNRGLSIEIVRQWTDAQSHDPGKVHRQTIMSLVQDANARYSAMKQEEQLLDATDQLLHTAELLEADQSGDIAARIGARFRYLFIDEFQDTDRTQKRIVDVLLPHLDGVLVVGDHKQSIYAFRGADVSLLQQLADDNDVSVLTLNISRRPTLPFLNLQNALFQSMGRRYPGLAEPLEAFEGTLEPTVGPPPLIVSHADERPGRIQQTAGIIQHLLEQQIDRIGEGTENIRPGHIVILTRGNMQASTYVEGLQGLGVDARIDTGDPLYTRPEIVSTYCMLRLLLYYPDDAVLSIALDTPYLRGVDLRRRERDLIQYEMAGTPLSDELENEHPEIHNRLTELRQSIRTDPVSKLLGRLYSAFSIQEHYSSKGNSLAVQNLSRLREVARRLFGEEQALTLRQFVSWLQIAITSRREEDFAEPLSDEEALPEHVRVMTVHRAKGLEFPIVILPEVQRPLVSAGDLSQDDGAQYRPFVVVDDWGLEVEVPVPTVQSTLSDEYGRFRQRQRAALIDEEMRIFYVAITRAQHAVVLIGKAKNRAQAPDTKYYSWQDEVIEAWPVLVGAGAVHHPRRDGTPGF